MNLDQQDHRTALMAFVIAVGAVGLAGCDQTAQIHVQTVPKQVIEEQEFPGLSEPEHTILAAMVPRENEAWVFRLDGPREDVASQAAAFESFIGSLSFAGGAARPEWELPAGWNERAASPGSLRETSIQVPVGDGRTLDLSVSRLPMREDWLHYRLRNFNRWRMQLQLPVAGADELVASTKTVALAGSDDASASILSISGKFSESELAKMSSRGMLTQRPATRSPAASPAAAGSADSGLEYELPEGWTTGPPHAMRLVSLVVSDGAQQATVAVNAFGLQSGPKIADPLANINRWRGEVGLPAVSEDEIESLTEPIEVDGRDGLYVALDSEGDPAGLATRAVMVELGDRIWFFKLQGPRELVERETERFREFIRSVEFAAK